jgi:hypothetical protein
MRKAPVWPGLFLLSNLIIADWGLLLCNCDPFCFVVVMADWGLTWVFVGIFFGFK